MSSNPHVLWAYTYRLEPPLPPARLKEIKALLEREHRAAKERAGTWEGRLVADERISHILVLADSPDLTLEANQRLEFALRSLRAEFNLTVPMVVPLARDEDIPQTD